MLEFLYRTYAFNSLLDHFSSLQVLKDQQWHQCRISNHWKLDSTTLHSQLAKKPIKYWMNVYGQSYSLTETGQLYKYQRLIAENVAEVVWAGKLVYVTKTGDVHDGNQILPSCFPHGIRTLVVMREWTGLYLVLTTDYLLYRKTPGGLLELLHPTPIKQLITSKDHYVYTTFEGECYVDGELRGVKCEVISAQLYERYDFRGPPVILLTDRQRLT